MRTQHLLFKEMLVNMGVSVPIHKPVVSDIKPLYITPVTSCYKTLVYKGSDLPTYHHIHHNAIIQK